ncbi:MAG TPA: hypothetical protein VFC03_02240 [Acidimicrobiales bacterium]|nr:hypothetical protein [Acidimicrobiales bacterium]
MIHGSGRLLPIWLATDVDAANTGHSNGDSNGQTPDTGVFDIDNGVTVDSQNIQGPSPCGTCGGRLNAYASWNVPVNQRGVQFAGFVNAINGISLSESYAVLSPNGRSVLFQRRQTAVAGGEADCFFWDGNTRASAAQGAGCLDVRNTQSEVQSAVMSRPGTRLTLWLR